MFQPRALTCHRQVAMVVRGPHAEDVLATACALDLAAAFHVEVWRSFARYVEDLLHSAESETV